MPRPQKTEVPATTTQSLGALLKSARDIMRKDKGLNGDLDRLPMLTWIMFLKFLDDLEIQREAEAKLAGNKFKPAIEPPYRWRDWAAKPDGITGDDLIRFINNDEAIRPDGKRGAGLFQYLRALTSANGDNRRDVVATVFQGVQNRMISGYLLRDVVNKIAGIHFTSSDELHTLGALYESMLREMRDAAGDSGEFYTPRAVVRLMVEVLDPRLGETVLDPASGTGGFLVEAFKHLHKQVKTVPDRKILQERSLLGGEPKPLPYLLCQMNLLLHGLDAPQIDSGNSLRHKLSEIGEKDRVDVILTNPPFGGEEEKGIQGNFPEDKQTAETALLFLQLIMRKLKRQPTPAGRPARAAVVVPNGTLFGDGVCARIKEELLKEAEALVPVKDLESAKTQLRTIQEKWDEAGKVPREDMSRIEGRLRKVEQAVRDLEDAKWTKTNPELNARAQSMVDQLERAVQGLEQDLEAAKASGNDKKIAEAQAALDARRQWLDSARDGLTEFGG